MTKSNYISPLIFVTAISVLITALAGHWGVIKNPAEIIIAIVTVVGFITAGVFSMSSNQVERLKARPVLSIAGSSFVLENKYMLTLNLKVKNNGQTLAKNLNSNISYLKVDGPLFGVPKNLKFPPIKNKSHGVPELAAQAELEVKHVISLEENEAEMLGDGLKIIFVQGAIKYSDEFGQTHSLNINCVQGRPLVTNSPVIAWAVGVGHNPFISNEF